MIGDQDKALLVQPDAGSHLDRFHSIKRAVTDAREHWDSANMMVQNLKELAGASDCALFSLDADGLLFVAHTAVDLTVPAEIRLGPGDTYAWKCLDDGKQLFIEDLANEGMRFDRLTAAKGKFASALYLPLVYRKLKLGVLALGFSVDKPCRLDETSRKLIDVLAAQAALLLDGMRLFHELEHKVQKERMVTERLQTAFLPTKLPKLPGFELATKYEPAAYDETLVGGDFYDLFELSEDRMGVVIADVSGKGISAAVYTAMTKYMLHAYAIEDPEITSVVERLNRSLCARIPPDYFVTLFYGIIDVPTRSFTYVNAGHEQPILAGSSVGCAVPLDVTGRALGLIPQSNFTSRTITLEPGDLLLLYTDGLTDYRTPFGRLGVEGLSQYLDWLIGAPADQIVDDLWSALTCNDPGGVRDDVAMLCLRAL